MSTFELPRLEYGGRPILEVRRTVFLGWAASGKTVVMTSLLDRILKANQIQRGGSTFHVGLLNVKGELSEFPLSAARDCIHNGYWPEKTTNDSELHVLSRWEGGGLPLYEHEHQFVDLPGERLADFPMIGRNYAEWSDWFYQELETQVLARKSASEFLRLVNTPREPSESDLIASYRLALSRWAIGCIPMVTPSSFLVHPSPRGAQTQDIYPRSEEPDVTRMTAEELAEDQRRFCGLNRKEQFVPLPKHHRDSELGRRYRAAYETYQKTFVLPLSRRLIQADHLVLLNDIMSTLEFGPASLHGTQTMVREAINYFTRSANLGTRISDTFWKLATAGRTISSAAHKIVLLASAADRVHQADRHKLVRLSQSAFRKSVEKATSADPTLSVHYDYCSAIRVTESVDHPEQRHLQGWKGEGAGRKRIQFTISDLPSDWPETAAWYANQQESESDAVYRSLKSALPPASVLFSEEFYRADPDTSFQRQDGDKRVLLPGLQMGALMSQLGWSGF